MSFKTCEICKKEKSVKRFSKNNTACMMCVKIPIPVQQPTGCDKFHVSGNQLLTFN